MHLERFPGCIGYILRVAVVPARSARVIDILPAFGCLASSYPGTVSICGITKILQIIDEHAGGEHNGIVVSKHSFNGCRELVGIPRHIGIDEIETAEPPPVENRLVNVRFRRFNIRDIISPPFVIRGDVSLIGLFRRLRTNAFILLLGGRKLLGKQPKLDFPSLLTVGGQVQVSGKMAVLRTHATARKARIDSGQIAVCLNYSGQLIPVFNADQRRSGAQGHIVRSALVDNSVLGYKNIVISDVLDQFHG